MTGVEVPAQELGGEPLDVPLSETFPHANITTFVPVGGSIINPPLLNLIESPPGEPLLLPLLLLVVESIR